MTNSFEDYLIPFGMMTISNLIVIVAVLSGIPLGNAVPQMAWILFLDLVFISFLLYELIKILPVGTKSLLFGVHQVLWHPLTVYFAWVRLYGFPNWKEVVCIFIHDWGYWGCPEMDGPEGEKHPERSALMIAKWLGFSDEYRLVLYHSRTFAAKDQVLPSKLCWADKLSIVYDPSWFYILRATLSGEIKEYRKGAADFGAVPLTASNFEWIKWAKTRMIKKAFEQDARPAYEAGS